MPRATSSRAMTRPARQLRQDGHAAQARSRTLDAATAGYRAPLRWDGDVCWVVDQRRLPDVLSDIEVRGAADAVTAMNDGAITGGAVQAQLAAVTLALVAGRSVNSRAFARRATIRGAANALRQTRPGSAAVGLTLARMLALLETFDKESTGEAVEAALRAEAEAVIAEASADHGAVVANALTVLPGGAETPLRVLTAGNTGAMGGGQFGTAVSAILTAHHEGREVHALVAEGRPGLEGARVASWELAQAAVPHALVTDAAAPGAIAAGEVDARSRDGGARVRQRRRHRDRGHVPARAGGARRGHPVPRAVRDGRRGPRDAERRGRTPRGRPPRSGPHRGRDAGRARGHAGPQPAPRPHAGARS